MENWPPAFWDKILLGAPGREEQIANLKTTTINMGKVSIIPSLTTLGHVQDETYTRSPHPTALCSRAQAGIPVMGYCFMLAGPVRSDSEI